MLQIHKMNIVKTKLPQRSNHLQNTLPQWSIRSVCQVVEPTATHVKKNPFLQTVLYGQMPIIQFNQTACLPGKNELPLKTHDLVEEIKYAGIFSTTTTEKQSFGFLWLESALMH